MERGHPRSLGLCAVGAACMALPSMAVAQTASPAQPAMTAPAPSTASSYNLGLPMFAAGSADPYNLSATTDTQTTAPAAASTTPTLPDSYTFDTFRQNIHGYVSAGIATHNGDNLSGGVTMPLVPGKVDLAFGADTGQVGGFQPLTPGGKRKALTYNDYYAGVHLHPSDNFDAYITVSRTHLGLPYGPIAPVGP